MLIVPRGTSSTRNRVTSVGKTGGVLAHPVIANAAINTALRISLFLSLLTCNLLPPSPVRGLGGLTSQGLRYRRAAFQIHPRSAKRNVIMKIRNSLKSLKDRHRDNRVIRRRGRTYVINKTNRRFKARQG